MSRLGYISSFPKTVPVYICHPTCNLVYVQVQTINHVIFFIVKVDWRSLFCWQWLRERMYIVGLPVLAPCNLRVAPPCSAGTWYLGWTFLHQWVHCRWKMLNFWPRNSTAENLSLRKQSILQTKIVSQKMLVPVLFITSWTPQDKSENN